MVSSFRCDHQNCHWAAVLFLLALLLGGSRGARAQSPMQFGGGLQVMGSTVVESAGPGLHLRASFPMNYELSFALGTSVTGFVLQGGKRAAYAFDPEASFVLTLPNSSNSSAYVLGGGGYHIPIGGKNRYDDVVGGPTFHVGLGKVWVMQATSLYVELSPTLFFRRERTDILFPLRGGIIF